MIAKLFAQLILGNKKASRSLAFLLTAIPRINLEYWLYE